MKTRLKILKLLLILCSTFATTAVFGQVITWIGPDAVLPGGADFGRTTNWSGGTEVGSLLFCGVICTFDGTIPGNLVVYSRNGVNGGPSAIGCEFAGQGVGIDLIPSQTGSVNLICYTGVTRSAAMRFDAFRVQNGAGQFILGDNTANQFVAVLEPAPGLHTWINNSANPVVINPNFQIQNGGGTPGHVINFQGTGDFAITNNLRFNNGSSAVPAGDIQWDSTGTTIWTDGGANNLFKSSLGVVTINAGTVIIKSAGLLPSFDHPGPNVITNNAILIYDAASQSDTILRVISGTGGLKVVSGALTLAAPNTYTGGTTIGGVGLLQVGNGGTSGALGSGNVTNNFVLVWNRSDDVTFSNVISGTGFFNKEGVGTLTLAAATNSFTGFNRISGGTLIINGHNFAASTYVSYTGCTLGGTGTLHGLVTVDAGATLAPGTSAGSIGTLTIISNLDLGGNLVFEVNKSLAQSNDFVVVNGGLINDGTGTLTVSNIGPSLQPGDKFTLFSKPVQNGAALTVTGSGAIWANNLAVDGSISVSGFVASPTLNWTNTGSGLQFSWTGDFKLQSQTNSLDVGLSTNWFDYPGGGTSPVTVPIDATKETVFFRLAPTP